MHHPTHHRPRFGRPGARLILILALSLALLLALIVGGLLLRSAVDPLARQQAEQALERQAQVDAALGWFDVALAGAWRVLLYVAAPATALAIAWRQLGSRATLDDYGQARIARAQAQLFPEQLQTLTYHDASKQEALDPALLLDLLADRRTIDGEAEEVGPRLTPDSEWRRWLDRAPHLLIAGRTDAGKTTLATALLAERALAGDEVLILDPHWQPGKWGGVPAIGGGNDFAAILDMLPRLIREMTLRYQEYERGKPTEQFRRLTVLIDEVPALVDATMETTPSGRPRITDPRWIKFAKKLGSEARKVRISVILLSQSELVADILINNQQRDNYLRIALGDRVRSLLGEADAGQKRQLLALLSGQEHPAAVEWKGDFHLLDTSAVPDLAARRIAHLAEIWTPPAPPSQRLAAPAAPLPPTQPVAAPPAATPVQSVGTAPMVYTVADQISDCLLAQRRWMTAAEIAAALSIDVRTIRTALTPMERSRAIVRRETSRPGREQYEYSVNQSISQPLRPPAA